MSLSESLASRVQATVGRQVSVARRRASKLKRAGRERFPKLPKGRQNSKSWHSEVDIQILPADDALNFRFFQFNVGTAAYFLVDEPSLKVRVSDTPHFAVAKAAQMGDEAAESVAKTRYLDYLTASWSALDLSTARADLDAKYERYSGLIRLIKGVGEIDPVFLTKLPGCEDYFVVDGNHRCAVAASLGLEVPAKVLTFQDTFDNYMRVEAFYGTEHRGMPYQSVQIGDVIVREGRRDDIFDRLALLSAEVLQNKSVLDVGANIGMNAIAAFRSGARSVTGLELSRQLTNYGARLAIFNDAYPQVNFEAFDLEKDLLDASRHFDIAFMLSVHDHLSSAEPLIRIALENVSETVVFEGHPGTDLEHYAVFLDAVGFSDISEIGVLATSVFDRRPTRPLWLMRK